MSKHLNARVMLFCLSFSFSLYALCIIRNTPPNMGVGHNPYQKNARYNPSLGQSLGFCHGSWLCLVDGCDLAIATSTDVTSFGGGRSFHLYLFRALQCGSDHL